MSITVGEIQEGAALEGGMAISPGDSRKGVVLFAMPEGAKPATFQYGLIGQRAEWKLS